MESTSNEVVDTNPTPIKIPRSKDKRRIIAQKITKRRALRRARIFPKPFIPYFPNDAFDMTSPIFRFIDHLESHRKNQLLPFSKDPTRCLPKSVDILYCHNCQTYSNPRRSYYFKDPKEPTLALLLRFLLGSLTFEFRLLQQHRVINAWLLGDLHDLMNIQVALKLESKSLGGSLGSTSEKTCIIRCRIFHQNCCTSCSNINIQPRSVVQVRQYVSHSSTSVRNTEFCILRDMPGSLNICRVESMDNGADFYLSNDNDAMNFYMFLCNALPVKRGEVIQKTDLPTYQNYISAVVSPLCKDDLVYIASESTLVICTSVETVIRCVDFSNLREYQISSDDYWREPFEPLKTNRELIEFIVLDIKNVSSRSLNSLANVRVARVSDFGKNDTTFVVRTHLGRVLKPGSYVLGYDLCEAKYTNVRFMLPDVILIKKRLAVKFPVPNKEVSPEYAKFVRDLEKNPEALFNLSLNDGHDKEQNSELSSENSGFDLDELLAHLELTGEKVVVI